MLPNFTLHSFAPPSRSGTRQRTGPSRFFPALTRLALAFLLGLPAFTFAQSPTVSMTFPQYNSSYISGTEINLQANATTPTGTTITKVEFYYDTNFFSPAANLTNPAYGVKIGEDLAAPYSMPWTPPTPTGPFRNYFVRAVVTNSAGSTAISNPTVYYTAITVYKPDYASTRNWYVSATAPSTNTAGTEAVPLNTIQKAADRVAPGDTVFVMAGTYTGTGINIVGIQRTGTPAKWIVFMPYKTDKPVVQLGNTNFNGFNVLSAAAYIKIRGFEVIGNNANITLAQAQQQPGACEGPSPTATPIARFNGNGMSISGSAVGGNLRPHHVVIANNTVHDCAGGGIGAGQADYVTMEDNTVYNNSWYTVYGTSGLNIINAWNSDNSTDIKIIIRRNRSFGNILKVAWNIGGTGTNCKFYDGNGIILDNNNAFLTNGNPKNPLGAYTGKFLIENNVTYLNGGRGINLNYTDNAIVLNNTCYQNGASEGGPGVGIENEFIMQGSAGARIYNNIFYGRAGEQITYVSNSTDALHNNNLTFGGTGTPYFSGNQNITGQDPQFVDAAGGNFQLSGTSPALNKGSSVAGQFAATDLLGIARPQGAGVDMGAYELQGVPITISQQPASETSACVGTDVSVSVTVDGPGPITYQWYNGETAITGNASATTATLMLDDVTAADAGSYKVVVTAFNQLTSNSFVLTVNPLPTPGITGGASVCLGSTLTLTGSPSGGTWNSDNPAAATVDASGLVSSVATGSTAITYSVTDGNNCTGITTKTVTVNGLPVVSITGLDASYCQNASAVTLTGSGIPSGGTGSFTVNGTLATQFNPASLAVNPPTHSVVFSYTDPNGCQNSATQPVDITQPVITQVAAVTRAPVCAGQAVILNFNVNCSVNASFTAELSDAAGNFPGYTFPGTVTPGIPDTLVIPAGTGAGTGYKIRVVGTNPALSTSSAAFTVNALGSVAVANYPATPSKICQGDALPVTFATMGACSFPVDNVFKVQLSSATGSFANPTLLGTAQSGTTTFALPANLPVGSGYRVRIVSSLPAQTSSASAPFKLEGPSLVTAPGVGQVPVCRGSELTVALNLPPNTCAFPEGNVFTAQLSNATGSFNNPTNLGNVTPSQSNALTVPASVAAGSGYRIRIVSSQPQLISPSSALFQVKACANRMSAEELRLVVMPNPVSGGEIRCRVSVLDNPDFGLINAAGRSLGLNSKRGEAPGEYVLTPRQALTPGVYVLQANEGSVRLTHRVLVVE